MARGTLTREAVLDAAVAIADAEGLAALSMRRLGTELGDTGIDTVKALMRAFDPRGILNPGNLMPDAPSPYVPDTTAKEVRA